jgi:hypothetical protein
MAVDDGDRGVAALRESTISVFGEHSCTFLRGCLTSASPPLHYVRAEPLKNNHKTLTRAHGIDDSP